MTNENVVVSTATNTREVLGDFFEEISFKKMSIEVFLAFFFKHINVFECLNNK